MVPCRQLFMWSVPSIAVLFGIFWLRKKREFAKSDPGGRERIKSLQEELAEALKAEIEAQRASPLGRAERSIIKSAPIDILPQGSSSQRSSPLELTDEEIDMEIEKIIRKKSLEKEKKSSFVGSQTLSVSTKQASFIVKESPPKQISMLQSDMACIKSELDNLSLKSANGTSVEDYNEMSESIETSQSSSVKQESAFSDVKIVEESTKADTEDTHANNLDNQSSNSSDNGNNRFSTAPARRISERDSANHSPVDPMLASPSMCHFSDNHSEGSSDSGKGCSEAASPPPTGMNIVPTEAGLRIHQFVISQTLVGLLIGKQGSFVTQIKAKTGASVYVRRHPDSVKQKICAVEGTQSEIEAALEMIKEKFPEKRFPNFSLQEISAELYQRLVPLVPEFLQLQLVESVNNDTIMTCLVSAGHFFLQQPLHPTFPSLHALHRLMAATYQNPDVPALPRPVKEGSICAAPTENNWYRAQVISTSEEQDTSIVKLVDFGGYLTVDNDQLKQIRSDFMTLPFQATEALLAFVKPANNEPEWSSEALRIMAGLTAGQLLHAQVAGYDEAGLPLVHLYLTLHPQQVIFLNRELVDRGLAEWEVPADS
ncbi:A-kinase anchor protein 1, mitochondrial isoform X1 [Leguminivora glycinivorella]|uniref:A-kinase anchor protein 1, mitochondrial isoform X1 n=1 Tax=Leguminivora glycinivorella TaxID=1035111 RepID=UPI00201037DB|nr:A-kinase anchor protein 1, mitochondrial isoform X1 [Leguminivora glycinivorella]XP_047988356.1 A-kinase anchor protein 1, mitochondrial isoform X1 [Leguminivora glycinivorella]XP_047988357.1 A-kinase anchor protein 1, mitochondrial isoform X1 [Leguminivora glycinivorella]XP_047988359.1 A-kinase anchor protein 1, mitochondrial isoform X1 [Leguminivora glycinivorella]